MPTLNLVQINVDDIDVARRFYTELLGFTEVGDPTSRVVTLALEGGPTLLLYPAQKRVEVDYPNQTGTTVVFGVEDIEATVRAWREKGVELIACEWSKEESGIGECPFGRFIAFRDPAGNVNEVIEPWKEDDART
jgi:catechol 2,3-dioxygenase-like lactoylglutathione lyase family enzyme